MQLKKRIKALFSSSSAEKLLAALMPALRELRANLRSVEFSRDPLADIIRFFNFVSPWQDRGLRDVIAAFRDVNYGQYDDVLEKLKTLQLHFERAGRSKYGWNRTKPGETVTEDNVYLGNIFGLWTKTVRFWKERKNEPKGGWGFSGMEHLNPYDVVSEQARKYMETHIGPMWELITGLDQHVRQRVRAA